MARELYLCDFRIIFSPLCGAQAIEKVILHVCFSNLFHIHHGIVKLTIVKKMFANFNAK